MNEETIKWIKATLLNDEVSTDEELEYYFVKEGLTEREAEFYVKQRDRALLNDLEFELEVQK